MYRREVVISKWGVCLLKVWISEELHIDYIPLPSRAHEICLLCVRGLHAQHQYEHDSNHSLVSGHFVSEHCKVADD